MALNITLEFRDVSVPELTDSVNFIRAELWQEMSEAWSLVLVLRSAAQTVEMEKAVGEYVRVHFSRDNDPTQAERFLPTLEGLVRRGRQLSTGRKDGMSTYELTIVPGLWLMTQKRHHTIIQRKTSPEIVELLVDSRNQVARVQMNKPKMLGTAPRVREYTVQYGDTDYDYARRILAEDGIAFFFTGPMLEDMTMVADTSETPSSIHASLPHRPSADALHGDEDAVLSVVFGVGVVPGGKMIRDYDFERPRFHADGKSVEADRFRQLGLVDYSYEEGALHAFDTAATKDVVLDDGGRNDVAARRHQDLLKHGWQAECKLTCPLPVGAVLTITGDHPIADIDLIVVRALTVLEWPEEANETRARRTHRVTCIAADFPFRPRQVPKPRIHGIQRATVTGPEDINVDEHGRVHCMFYWDLAGDSIEKPNATNFQLTRRVPVSHGWAGPTHGFVVLPRAGDEVLVAYIDGDPDQPLVVGRVYNGANLGAVKLPDDRTQSLWRTESTPSHAGFHEIRFEDRSGKEELHIEAQRLHTRLVKGSEQITVGGGRSISVGGTQTEKIGDDLLYDVKNTIKEKSITHAIECSFLTEDTGYLTERSQEHTQHSKGFMLIKSDENINIQAPEIHILGGGYISLEVGGSFIHIDKGKITIKAPVVEINP
jgi:type VI secretion system secreted protein VgrG